ncbi:pyroglutamyl-peptidase I [Microbacterium oleivorans]|uniref:pyroglutamyl-peptidase I n=1 Tax=Microbacterium oleivorans TaxID=273677 RepID=UPI00157A2715|nr:pyroglutamyl-peptidase I [Microbacterium oleivorans]
MPTVLLTGFEPFAGDTVNPSGDAVRAVAERWAGPERLIVDVLPVTFDGATARLAALLDEHRPDVVVSVGLAGDRSTVTPERVAVNLADARIADNAGHRPQDAAVVAGGPAAYFATLPVKAIAAGLANRGIPSTVSHTAGTFVCNATMYAALHATTGTPVRAGFIHVPWAAGTAPAGAPALDFADIVDAVELAVRVSLDVDTDVAAAGGELP